MPADPAKSERIEEILTDTYDDFEQLSAWEVTFQDEVETPFPVFLSGVPAEVQGFQVGDDGALQCLVTGKGGKRWVGLEDLDPKGLPDDFADLFDLYRTWQSGDY